MISDQLKSGLLHLSDLMQGEATPWWIIGSTALVLSRIEGVEPDDIDVVASGDCLRRVLAKANIAETPPKPHPKFSSTPYQRIKFEGATPIELMGDLAVKNSSQHIPVTFQTRIKVQIASTTLFIPSPAEQIALFHLFGRDKDLAKAAMLEQQIADQTRP